MGLGQWLVRGVGVVVGPQVRSRPWERCLAPRIRRLRKPLTVNSALTYNDNRQRLTFLGVPVSDNDLMHKPLYQSSRLRKGRASIPGQAYLITSTTHERNPLFQDPLKARILCQSFLKMDALALSRTLCFVVMPDHFHWMMVLGEGRSLSQVVKMYKNRTARMLGGRIWQTGFHDRAIRREEDLLPVARYVVANPVRAGIVKSVREYSYWDAIWL